MNAKWGSRVWDVNFGEENRDLKMGVWEGILYIPELFILVDIRVGSVLFPGDELPHRCQLPKGSTRQVQGHTIRLGTLLERCRYGTL